MSACKYILAFIILFSITSNTALAVQIPKGQDAGSAIEDYTRQKQKEMMHKDLAEEKLEKPSIDASEMHILPGGAETIYISKIICQYSMPAKKLLDDKEIDMLIHDYTDKELSIEGIKSIAKHINDKYSDLNINAYIPEQAFQSNILYINIL